jgi:acyl-CoA synthetase (AMP-forming)/AMP-acid ligase II
MDVPEGETGELLIRSPGLTLGYLHNPGATADALRDGWLWTGDLARRDAEGFYYLEGRRALRINVGGLKVAPEEVEAVLAQHPAVREVVALAMPDAARGEVVRVVIVPEGPPPSVSTLRRYCRERLAGYKVPRRWEFRDELPRSSLGKVLRHNL